MSPSPHCTEKTTLPHDNVKKYGNKTCKKRAPHWRHISLVFINDVFIVGIYNNPPLDVIRGWVV